MRRLLVLLLCSAAGLPAGARVARAAWPHDNVNGGVVVSNTVQSAGVPMMIPDGSGGAFVAWAEVRVAGQDVCMQRLSAAGVPLWTANGVTVCGAGAGQSVISLAPDGAGGALVAWQDGRNAGSIDIYAQRVGPGGTMAWTANGVAICTAVADQTEPAIISDGAGGAIVGWTDARSGINDVYAQRVNSAGTPMWTADGVAIVSVAGQKQSVKLLSDKNGGAVFTWSDLRSGVDFDIYAQRLISNGTRYWGSGAGLAVCTAGGNQTAPAICTDGANDFMIAWTDQRAGNRDIYVQRIWYPGIALWAANGVAACTVAGDQQYVVAIPDGTGGLIAAWGDSRAGYSGPAAQRFNYNGVPQWTAGGVLASIGFSASSSVLSFASDGLGGLLAAWTDYRSSGNGDIYAARLDPSGSPVWTAGGVPVNLNPAQDDGSAVCADGAGGAIVAFVDYRNQPTAALDLFASRVDRFGVMGGEPVIASVTDVPNDQGGLVRVAWNASPLDLDPASYAVTSYLLFRSAPPGLVAEAVGAGRVTRLLEAFEGGGSESFPLYAQPLGTEVYYWEYVGEQAAYHLPTYGMVTATTGDSVGGSNPLTAFLLQARNANGTQWWNSAPDSGYSVDDLAPAAPAPFTGEYAAGATTLHWNPNPEPDLAGYELYRGGSTGFVPGPGNLVASLPDTGYADASGAPYVYKLLAVDTHGNRSPVATLVPAGTLDVADGAAAVSFLAPPRPNPSRGGALFTLGLGRGGAARLVVYDAQGRRVRTLLAGTLESGEHRVRWDGRDEAGIAAAPGLYLVRFEGPGFAKTRRLAVVE